jgi:hypothetical protein
MLDDWWRLVTVLFGSAEATGELRCTPDERKLIGPTLLDKLREESITSVEPAGLLLEMTALLEELPPRTYDDECTRSGSVIPGRPPCRWNQYQGLLFLWVQSVSNQSNLIVKNLWKCYLNLTERITVSPMLDGVAFVSHRAMVKINWTTHRSNIKLINSEKHTSFAVVSSSPGLLCFGASIDPEGKTPVESLRRLPSGASAFRWTSLVSWPPATISLH